MAKRRRLNSNRNQKQGEPGLFAFDPVRKNLIKWGAIAGTLGGFFMVQQSSLLWQIGGVSIVVFVANYHINKAAERIPRWHAVVNAFIGVFIAMFAAIILGTIILATIDGL